MFVVFFFVKFCFRLAERAAHEILLFEFMRVRRAGRRTGGFKTADGREWKSAKKMFAEFFVQVTPRAHVRRLFLNPKRRRVFRAGFQRLFQKSGVQRIKLLKPDNGDVIAFVFFAISGEIVNKFCRCKSGCVLHFLILNYPATRVEIFRPRNLPGTKSLSDAAKGFSA